jgi:NADH-quinone oxidoreductase subunit J
MELFFYLFAFLLITSAIGVISSNNPVYSVLWLIFAFCNASGLFLLLGAEFLAFTLVIVYVGAVAVLFLFVVMMLDINITAIKASLTRNWPMGLLCLTVFAVDIISIMILGFKSDGANTTLHVDLNLGSVLNIGSVLYTKYMLPFQMAGVILLIAMIGCIALTLRHLTFVKRQDPSIQLARSKKNGMKLLKIKNNTGVKGLMY